MFRAILEGTLDLLYPPRCAACRSFGEGPLCGECLAGIEEGPAAGCARCGRSLRERQDSDPYCLDCRPETDHRFRSVRAHGPFVGVLREAVLALKYGGRSSLGPILGAYAARALQRAPLLLPSDGAPVVIPIPLHSSRLRERGFNQSGLIAAPVAEMLGVPVSTQVLKRTRRTRPQASLPMHARHENVRGAFAVPQRSDVDGRVVVLVDDVVTTMHTVSEAARALDDAGALAIHVVAVARG